MDSKIIIVDKTTRFAILLCLSRRKMDIALQTDTIIKNIDTTSESYRKTLYSIHLMNTKCDKLDHDCARLFQLTKQYADKLREIDLEIHQVRPVLDMYKSMRSSLRRLKLMCTALNFVNNFQYSIARRYRSKISTRKSISHTINYLDLSLSIVNDVIYDLKLIPVILSRKK